jgi:galactose mutarotase-like enzyme
MVRSGTSGRRRPGLLGALVALLVSGTPAAAAAGRYTVHETTTAENVRLVVLSDAASRVEAAVAPTEGGELSSLRVEFQGRWIEMLHRARTYAAAPGFRGKAMILWPALGPSIPPNPQRVDGRIVSEYDYQGRRYAMPAHGFALSKPWRVARSWATEAEAAVEVVLTDDAETRKQYPFGFEFRLIYRLSEGRVELQHRIKASPANVEPMFFSIGNHITFAVPLLPESPASGFTIESPARFEFPRTADGPPDGTARERRFSPAVTLDSLKIVPAVSVGGYDGDPWFRLTDASGLGAKVSHHAETMPIPPYVQFNLWGGTAEGYFCPEPFLGLHNSLNLRAGRIELAPGETWQWIVRVEPERAGGNRK